MVKIQYLRPAVLAILMILASLAVMIPTAASASELTTAACTGASRCTSKTCTTSVTETGEESTCTSTSIYRVCRRSRGAKRPHCETVVNRYTETIIKEVVIKEVVAQPQT